MPIFNSYVHIKLEKGVDPLAPVISISTHLSPVMKLDRALSLFRARMWETLSGVLRPAIYVMSADCGTGKSAAVQAVLKEWKAKRFAGTGGAIVFVGTLAEVDAYKDGAGLDRADYAVLSPDAVYKTYGAGLAAAGDVPVLFVTHEKARRVLAGLDSFSDATAFHYKGKPRTLRVWEEAFFPAQYAAFELNDLRSLPAALRGRSNVDIKLVERLLPDSDKLVEGHAINVPAAMASVAEAVFKSGHELPERSRLALEGMAKLARSKAYLTGDDETGWRLVGAGRPLPADIGPLFVLDASARLTGRYDDWSAYGMDVVRLDPALIGYGPLAIHWWDKGCGKRVLRNSSDRLSIYDAIANLVSAKPSEDFLIVMAKEFVRVGQEERAQIPDDLLSKLDDPKRVHVTTWGRHLGCNDHRDVANVILLGSGPIAVGDAI